jgi:HEAT repeat protein
MFDQDKWRAHIVERLNTFARNPRQDIHLTGTTTVLAYLAVRTLEPFLDAFQREPVAAVLALAQITQGPGADHIVRRAAQMRYQAAHLLERELRTTAPLRAAIEQLIVALDVIHLARQRLNSSRDEWLRLTLLHEIAGYDADEFTQLHRLLTDPGWQMRYDAIRSLQQRKGHYTSADLVLLRDGLKDSAAHVRAAAARTLGYLAGTPPMPLIKALIKVAIFDCDLKTRYAAARALGAFRERIVSPQLIDYLVVCLDEKDSFVRTATALVLSEIGEPASAPPLITKLTALLQDPDFYAREAAARALGTMGAAAATSEVIDALTCAVRDGDSSVHEAAVESLAHLHKLRAAQPVVPSLPRPEPLPATDEQERAVADTFMSSS